MLEYRLQHLSFPLLPVLPSSPVRSNDITAFLLLPVSLCSHIVVLTPGFPTVPPVQRLLLQAPYTLRPIRRAGCTLCGRR